MKRGLSIGLRLTLGYAAILAITFALAGVATWATIRSSINTAVDRDLRVRLQAIRDYVEKQPPRVGIQQLAAEFEEDAELFPAGTNARISDANGKIIYQSPGTSSWPDVPSGSLPEAGETRTLAIGGRDLRILVAPVRVGEVQVGIPMEPFERMLQQFAWTAALATPVLLLLASAGGFWMSRHALRPVSQIERTAAEIGAQNLSQRLPVRGSGDEMDRLSMTLNAMFDRIEASFRKIAQFTADASHELRTPVAIIRGTAELARNKARSTEEYEKALDSILRESERTSRLIGDLLLLARADAGADVPVREPMNLAECVAEACEEAGVLAEKAGLELVTSLPAECGMHGDCEGLRRLMLILLDNAVRHTSAGGNIRVRLVPNGGTATVEVEDTGSGIPAEDLPHVFERFYRASKDRSRETGGTGLGLSIAQWLARQHGGEILVESKLATGSVFRVVLPLQT